LIIEIALAVQAIPPIPTHFSVAGCVVCLTFVLPDPDSNSLTDFDAILQVHVWGSIRHCVRWGLDGLTPMGRADLGQIPSRNMQLLPTYIELANALTNHYRPPTTYLLATVHFVTVDRQMNNESCHKRHRSVNIRPNKNNNTDNI